MKNIHVVGCFCKIIRCHGKFLFDRYVSLSGKRIDHVSVIRNVLQRVRNLTNLQHWIEFPKVQIVCRRNGH